jgi:hypothetical protein
MQYSSYSLPDLVWEQLGIVAASIPVFDANPNEQI